MASAQNPAPVPTLLDRLPSRGYFLDFSPTVTPRPPRWRRPAASPSRRSAGSSNPRGPGGVLLKAYWRRAPFRLISAQSAWRPPGMCPVLSLGASRPIPGLHGAVLPCAMLRISRGVRRRRPQPQRVASDPSLFRGRLLKRQAPLTIGRWPRRPGRRSLPACRAHACRGRRGLTVRGCYQARARARARAHGGREPWSVRRQARGGRQRPALPRARLSRNAHVCGIGCWRGAVIGGGTRLHRQAPQWCAPSVAGARMPGPSHALVHAAPGPCARPSPLQPRPVR